MWKPYLKVLADEAGHALNVLDRLHIAQHLNHAVDEVRRAESSRLEPMKMMVRMLRAHEDLLLNWFGACGELSSAAVQGLNNRSRGVTRQSYGFRTYNGIEGALYHSRLDDYPNLKLPADFSDEA